MLISVEHEMPVVSEKGRAGIVPEVFTDLWSSLSKDGWQQDGAFAVSRRVPFAHANAQKPHQTITTDTGPTIEISPTPCERVGEVNAQLGEMRYYLKQQLQQHDLHLLGIGVHPSIDTSIEDYYRFRTPRPAYDYVIRERGWDHRSILNIAAMQEVIDIPVAKAPAIVSLMHRLTGPMLFLFRNDPLFAENGHPVFSVRPDAWRKQVPSSARFPSDARKTQLPPYLTDTWQQYLALLWSENPMFVLGTKSDGAVYVPEHPTFEQFMTSPPNGGWQARRIDSGACVSIQPDMSHVAQTDWTYMGFARLRIFWHDGVSLDDLRGAFATGGDHLHSFMADAASKVLLENRSSATPPPGAETCSLAFVVGLLENLDETLQFVQQHSYQSWMQIARAAESTALAEYQPDSVIMGMLSNLLLLSETGLTRRGFNEEAYLAPLYARIRDRYSESERLLSLYQNGGIAAVINATRY